MVVRTPWIRTEPLEFLPIYVDDLDNTTISVGLLLVSV